jgi:hypothetical protein
MFVINFMCLYLHIHIFMSHIFINSEYLYTVLFLYISKKIVSYFLLYLSVIYLSHIFIRISDTYIYILS